MKKRPNRQHRFGLSKVQRSQLQIKALTEELEKLRQKTDIDTPEYRAKYCTEKDALVVKLKERVQRLEKKLGNKVFEIFCSIHGFNFSYNERCPECKEKKDGSNPKTRI